MNIPTRLGRAAVFATAIGAFSSSGILSGPAQAQEVIRVGYCVQVHQATMMILPEVAEKNGVKIELTPMRRYADLQLALTTGQVDMGVLGYINLGLMHENDTTDYKAVAGVFNGAQSLTLGEGVSVSNWSDLEGKRLGSPPNSTAELLFKASMAANGADPSKVNFVSFTTAGPPMLAALENKDIDAFVAWEPTNADAELAGYGKYAPLDLGDNPTKGVNGVLLARSDFAEANPEGVQGVVDALVAATGMLEKDRDLYVKTAVAGTGASSEVVGAAIPHGTLDTRLPLAEAKAMMKLIADGGLVKKDWSDAIEEKFDYQFLEAATGRSRSELGG